MAASAAATSVWGFAAASRPESDRNRLDANGQQVDNSLVERCLAGDDTAWEGLVKAYTRRVYGLCYRFTGRDSDAQDLTQDVFVRVFRALGSFRSSEGSFATWVTRLTRNLLIDHYRRTRNERVTESIEDQLPRIEDGAGFGNASGKTSNDSFHSLARPDSALAGREASELLQAALQKLSPELRETIILRDLQEMDYREIAVALEIPEGTVKSRLNRGRAELARLLKKYRVAV